MNVGLNDSSTQPTEIIKNLANFNLVNLNLATYFLTYLLDKIELSR